MKVYSQFYPYTFTYDILIEDKLMPIKKTKAGYVSSYGGKKTKHKSKASALARRKKYTKKK
jgi:hypothetical protein